MHRGCYIITGTSRGIGEALAEALLKGGHDVLGIAKARSDKLISYAAYEHRQADLSNLSEIEQLMTSIVQARASEATEIFLVNNAAVVEPLLPIDHCQADEIISSLQVSLIAPIICTAAFLRNTNHLNMRRKVVNISSGSGIHPLPDMSIYSTAKAGINMFTRCVGSEQSNGDRPVEVIAVDPGMVETRMQQVARESKDDFAMAGYFDNAYRTGQLQAPDAVAQQLVRIIQDVQEPGRIMTYME